MSISGFPKETVRVVKDGPLILGRDPSNQLEVGDPAVSRKHCSVSEVSSGVFEIADLDSHNGTFVNGERVSRQTIEHGDRIRIGNSEFVFLTGPDEETDPLSSRSGNYATNSELKTMSLDRSGLPTGDSVGRSNGARSDCIFQDCEHDQFHSQRASLAARVAGAYLRSDPSLTGCNRASAERE